MLELELHEITLDKITSFLWKLTNAWTSLRGSRSLLDPTIEHFSSKMWDFDDVIVATSVWRLYREFFVCHLKYSPITLSADFQIMSNSSSWSEQKFADAIRLTMYNDF